MPLKLMLGFNVLLLGVGGYLAVQLSGMSRSINTLTQRVTDLEVQNVQLSRQLEWVEQNNANSKNNRNVRSSSRQTSMNRVGRKGTQDDTTLLANAEISSEREMAALKEEMRQEVQDIVADERAERRKKRREEWEKRMRESMTESLDDFAEDHQLDDDVKSQIAVLLDESMNRRGELRDEMNERNLSFYEFREKERELRDEIDTRLSELLTEEQMEVFQDRFPMGPRRRGPRGGER